MPSNRSLQSWSCPILTRKYPPCTLFVLGSSGAKRFENMTPFEMLGNFWEAMMKDKPTGWVLVTFYMLQFPTTLAIDACLIAACVRSLLVPDTTAVDQQAKP